MGSISILFFDNVFVILNNQNFIVLISKKIPYLTRFYAKTLSSLFFVFFYQNQVLVLCVIHKSVAQYDSINSQSIILIM